MTREEAIKWLNAEASYIEADIGNGKEILEAYDMAIKALEQEHCEDAISRQAVIDAIYKWIKNMGVLTAIPATKVIPLFDNIHKLPPVTPQQVSCEEREKGECPWYAE